jgi:hydroxymethylpyrimidine pyrophosphatase-like HAD family hydrolase
VILYESEVTNTAFIGHRTLPCPCRVIRVYKEEVYRAGIYKELYWQIDLAQIDDKIVNELNPSQLKVHWTITYQLEHLRKDCLKRKADKNLKEFFYKLSNKTSK